MRALTQEEVRFVAGGDNLGDTMISGGQGLQRYSSVVSTLGPIGRVVGPIMYAGGVALVSQGKQRNAETDGPVGGGVGSGGEGGANPSGGGGQSLPGSGTGGGTGGGSQTGCSTGDPDCVIIWHPN